MKKIALFITAGLIMSFVSAQTIITQNKEKADSFNNHKVILDNQSKLISWITPQSRAYDQFLHQRWNFIKTRVPYSPGPPPRSSYPQYCFYCAYWIKNGKLEPNDQMNDVGEKIPNWFENARLYYAYTGDTSVMTIMRNLIDYTMVSARTIP
jgi:hypothetical protein